jgi:hypothetical protein
MEEQLKVRITTLQFCEELDLLLVGLSDGSIIQMQVTVELAPLFSDPKAAVLDEQKQQ